MTPKFKVGDHVEWNSEAGRVRGTIKKRVVSAITIENALNPAIEFVEDVKSIELGEGSYVEDHEYFGELASI